MSNYIPEDIWPEILKRLPVKSLARFRCVCRQWNALICSSDFIADHLDCSKSKPCLFINDVYHSGEKSCVIFDSDSSSAANFSPRIVSTDLCPYQLVGSAKGIICFHVYCDQRCQIVLWNPVINTYIKLPDALHTHSTSNWVLMSVAIGVKPSEQDDLRVLRLSSDRHGIWRNAAVVAEIYSVRQREWRVLHTNTPRIDNFLYDSVLKPYVDGGVYWVSRTNEVGSYMLIHFGFEEEEFICITLPDVLADSHPYNLDVGVYCGRLALLQRGFEDSCWKIWTRGGNEDSWSVIISINPADFIHGFTHDGQILMSRGDYNDDDNEVVLYNTTSRSFRELDMHAGGWVRACPFVESLVFMDGEGGAVPP